MITLLMIHGLLHLAGYEHEGTRKGAQAMARKQKELSVPWIIGNCNVKAKLNQIHSKSTSNSSTFDFPFNLIYFNLHYSIFSIKYPSFGGLNRFRKASS
jgi:hypothetical protein